MRTVGFAAVAAAATGFVVAWFGGDGTVSHWLLAYAGSLEFWGVLLVASPEIAPSLRRLAVALVALRSQTKALAHRAANRARELVPIAVELRRRSWVNYLTRGKRRPPAPVSGKR